MTFPGIKLRRRDPERRMARYYQMTIQCALCFTQDDENRTGLDLDGAFDLVREWGRINSPGRVQVERFANAADAEMSMATLENRKRRKGYR